MRVEVGCGGGMMEVGGWRWNVRRDVRERWDGGDGM